LHGQSVHSAPALVTHGGTFINRANTVAASRRPLVRRSSAHSPSRYLAGSTPPPAASLRQWASLVFGWPNWTTRESSELTPLRVFVPLEGTFTNTGTKIAITNGFLLLNLHTDNRGLTARTGRYERLGFLLCRVGKILGVPWATSVRRGFDWHSDGGILAVITLCGNLTWRPLVFPPVCRARQRRFDPGLGYHQAHGGRPLFLPGRKLSTVPLSRDPTAWLPTRPFWCSTTGDFDPAPQDHLSRNSGLWGSTRARLGAFTNQGRSHRDRWRHPDRPKATPFRGGHSDRCHLAATGGSTWISLSRPQPPTPRTFPGCPPIATFT